VQYFLGIGQDSSDTLKIYFEPTPDFFDFYCLLQSWQGIGYPNITEMTIQR
jgi:hypothetical protein